MAIRAGAGLDLNSVVSARGRGRPSGHDVIVVFAAFNLLKTRLFTIVSVNDFISPIRNRNCHQCSSALALKAWESSQ